MKHFLDMLELINKNPLARKNKINSFIKFIKWEILSRTLNKSFVYRYVNESKLIMKKGMDGATGNIFLGLRDYHEMCMTLHFLRENDLFVDIGANVGVYAVLASAVKKAKSIAVEPIPEPFQNLINNLKINKIENIVEALNLGLGDEDAELMFTKNLDCENRIAVASDKESECIKVPVKTLDEIIKTRNPIMLKIDVEGYEEKVLKGAKQILQRDSLKVLIVELHNLGGKYSIDDKNNHDMLLGLKFQPYDYIPELRELRLRDTFAFHNTIYVRDAAFVQKRLSTADKIKVLNQEI